MKTLLGLVFGALLLLPGLAHASGGEGYVCESEEYNVGGPGAGAAGALFLSVTAGPSCTGAYLGSGFICTAPAGSTPLSSICSWWGVRSPTALVSLLQKLQSASSLNQKVYLAMDGANVYTVTFYATGK